MVGTDEIARRMGFASQNAPDYDSFVKSFKADFIIRDHPELLDGPEKMKKDGNMAPWELGLQAIWEQYPDQWKLENFANPAQRRAYANSFLVNQAKKARYDKKNQERRDELKKRLAEEAAAKKSRQSLQAASGQKARGRGRKRLRTNSSPPGYHSPSRQSSLSSPKRHKGFKFERPNLEFRSFAIILKDRANPPATSYECVTEFEDLLDWILKKNTALSGQRIVCWSELIIRNPDYGEMMGCELGQKYNRIFSDQASWDAAVLAAQANRPTPTLFHGFAIFAALAKDAPEHDEGDVIALEDETSQNAPEIEVEEETVGPDKELEVGEDADNGGEESVASKEEPSHCL